MREVLVALALMLVLAGVAWLLRRRRVALLTAAPMPAVRGAFMSVNGALQSGAMGLAAWVGGLLISRSPEGLVQGYGGTGWLALVTSLFVAWWVGRLTLHVQGGQPVPKG